MNINDILERIKKIFKKEKRNLLTDGQHLNIKRDNSFLEGIKYIVKEDKKEDEVYKVGTLDCAIDQYIQGMAYSYFNKDYKSSYAVLTGLYTSVEQPKGLNDQKERNLIRKLKDYKEYYDVIEQGNDETAFFHIKSKGMENYKREDIIRLYIQVKREYIAEVSEALLNAFGNEQFYFKFVSDNEIENNVRSESIVIYEDKEKVGKTLEKIDKIAKFYPQFFEDSNKSGNPFLKRTCNGIVSYAPEVTDEYIDRKGAIRKINPSFNSKLAIALGESYIQAAYDLIIEKRDIRRKLDKEFLENVDAYKSIPNMNNGKKYDYNINQSLYAFVSAYPYIAEKHKAELVQKVKENLLEAKSKNPDLDIITDEANKNIQSER